VRLREFGSVADYHQCVAVQNEVWGSEGAGHTVPASLLLAASHVGALGIGAFDAEGAMLGFVFGLTGVKEGEVVHWSHMLAVRETAREKGLGRMLKEFQRAELARRGIAHIYWTFDPLQARNAHLNLNLLGARVVEYVPDMYGTSDSPLHFGLATDRLVVSYPTTATHTRRPTPPTPAAGVPVMTPFPRRGDLSDGTGENDTLLIEIPARLDDGADVSPQDMADWRMRTRESFEWALAHGYAVTRLRRDAATGRSFYVAERESHGAPS
jgi:predicted GNAT superfamily acetyltransferase